MKNDTILRGLTSAAYALSITCAPPVTAAEEKVVLTCDHSAYEIDYRRSQVRDPVSGRTYRAEITDSTIRWFQKLGKSDPGANIALNRYTGELTGRYVGNVRPPYFTSKCTVSQKRF